MPSFRRTRAAYAASGPRGQLAVGAAVMATLAIASVVIAQASPAPTRSDDSRFFAQPFEYAVPATMDPAATMSETSVLWALAEGIPDTASPYGSVQSDARETGARGVLVADVTQALAHPCPGVDGGRSRVDVGDGPTAFVDDMRTIAGLVLKDISETTLDSRPATATRSGRKSECETTDIHLPGFATSDRIELGVPSRIIVTEVAGSTILVQAWAGTPDALQAWLPIAREFIDSIHFLDPDGESVSAAPSIVAMPTVASPQALLPVTTSTKVATGVVVPFEYTIPASMDPVAAGGRPDVWALAESVPDPDSAYGPVQFDASKTGARGVLVADVTDAVTHPCHSRMEYANRGPLADAPEAFLEDMRRYGGLVLDGPSASTFDGRPALEASFKEAICDTVDIHLQSFRTPSEHIRLDVPFRIIVTEVAGSTIMIEAWAGSPEALEEWLPIADEFIDSIHFIE